MKRPPFVTNEIYHIYNRGVEKRKIFLNDKNRFRFIHDLFEFNDNQSIKNIYRLANEINSYLGKERKPRKYMVEILAFCLMPNHYHLLLRQKEDNGIVRFMQKLNTGYTKYFNQKYDRVGPLLQGRFKAAFVKEESYLIHLFYYIHLNPLGLILPEWQNKKINNHNKAINFLESYRWSSFLDYIGQKNFPSVTQREFLLEFFGYRKSIQYRQLIKSWLSEIEIEKIKSMKLE